MHVGFPKDMSFASGKRGMKCICGVHLPRSSDFSPSLANSPPCAHPPQVPGEVEKKLNTGRASSQARLKTPHTSPHTTSALLLTKPRRAESQASSVETPKCPSLSPLAEHLATPSSAKSCPVPLTDMAQG